jgi:uncharacterized phage protein gp47/JayE
MPFARPTLSTLRQQAMQDIVSSDLPNANSYLRRAVLRVLAWVQAGMAYLHFGFLDWIAQQGVPFTCTDEFLDAWAGLKAVLREPATAATGTWSGTGANGTSLPSGTALVRGDGFTYATTAAATVSGGTISVPFAAATTGVDGNAESGSPLTLGTVISGINSAGTAAAAVTGGADQETDAALRTRMLQAYAAPAQGGAETDYVEWAEQVPGVTRAWCNPLGLGVGTVVVYTMFDLTEAAYNGFPQGTNGVATAETRGSAATGDQLAVANYIFPRRPVTALVYSYAPAPQTLNLSIGGIPSGLRAAATAAIAALLVQNGSPLADVAIDQSDVDEAISAVVGTTQFRVTAPSFPQTPALGSLFVLGTITYS